MINAYCPFFGRLSFAQHARGFIRALNRITAVGLIPFRAAKGAVDDEVREMLARGRTPDLRQPGLSIGAIYDLPRAAGAWRIGFTVWETTRLPPAHMAALRELDEVWTPSSWGRRVLIDSGLAEERVRVVPEGVDPDVFRPCSGRRGSNGPFRFLCVGRWSIRKGVDELVRAFSEEFAPHEDVELVLHCAFAGDTGADLPARIAKAAPAAHAPIVPSGPRAQPEMAALYQSCDAFVLPTRGEGWGLPIVEAMACGLPVITTGYSAPADYLDEAIAYPLRVAKLEDVNAPAYDRGAGQWALPDFAHLRALMRHVFENREEARAKGARAAETVRRDWTWARAAETAYALLCDRIVHA
ncbi:MAG TPA: glycosyltransferase family 4 protein [Thermoanaerobaculia bacterium]|nr:glycosyltransferase family 4 protein [Thermoanaerobaculia bacterium]